jgi:hypothetical protein
MRISEQLGAVLNLIDVTLASGGDDAKALANILSAIRGADGLEGDNVVYNGVYYPTARKLRNAVKKQTTGIIRAIAFPKTAMAQPSGDGDLQWVTTRGATKIAGDALKGLPKHFVRHIKQAADALGIELVGAEDVLRLSVEAPADARRAA